MKHILDAVKQYIDEKHAAKTWTAGKDFVNYAGLAVENWVNNH